MLVTSPATQSASFLPTLPTVVRAEVSAAQMAVTADAARVTPAVTLPTLPVTASARTDPAVPAEVVPPILMRSICRSADAPVPVKLWGWVVPTLALTVVTLTVVTPLILATSACTYCTSISGISTRFPVASPMNTTRPADANAAFGGSNRYHPPDRSLTPPLV
jgi:hypothetical protein